MHSSVLIAILTENVSFSYFTYGMAEQIDQLARMTPQERKILEGISKRNCLERLSTLRAHGCTRSPITFSHTLLRKMSCRHVASNARSTEN
jgi:hypothetical protein